MNSRYEDPARVIERFNSYFHENYNTSPVVFVSTLAQAMNEAPFPDAAGGGMRVILCWSTFTQWSECIQQDFLFVDLLQNYVIWPWNITAEMNNAR